MKSGARQCAAHVIRRPASKENGGGGNTDKKPQAGARIQARLALFLVVFFMQISPTILFNSTPD